MEQLAAAGGWRKGPWTPQEDKLLLQYVTENGEGRWSSVSKCTGLKRSGKSCRLRWVNYLRPGLKKGHLTPQEQGIVIELHSIWGNRWSTIARYLPGRTDNEIKNYWRTHFKSRKAAEKKSHKLQLQQQFKTDDHAINDISEEISQVTTNSKKEEEMAMDKNHDQLVPADAVYEESDFIPMDCYLWGGLWNMDDDYDHHHHLPINAAEQNQGNVTYNYYRPFEGDAFDYQFLL